MCSYLSDDGVDVLRVVVIPAMRACDGRILIAESIIGRLVVIAIEHAALAEGAILFHGDTINCVPTERCFQINFILQYKWQLLVVS